VLAPRVQACGCAVKEDGLLKVGRGWRGNKKDKVLLGGAHLQITFDASKKVGSSRH